MIAKKLAEKRRREEQRQREVEAASREGTPLGHGDSEELVAKREADAIIAKRAMQEPAELVAAKEALAAGLALRGAHGAGTCPICNEALQDAKRLPCGHAFHFKCIMEFHRKKLEEKQLDLPCFTCGAPSHKSIDVLSQELKQERAAEAAAKKAEEEAAAQAVEEERLATMRQEFRASQTMGGTRQRGGAMAALAQATR